jgi:hypothetical protein
MSQSKSIKVADAVAAAITTLIAGSTPVVRMAPSSDFRKITSRQLFVWPAARSTEPMTRNSVKADYEIAIALIERIPATDNTDTLADQLLEIVEDIADKLTLQVRVLTLADNSTIEVLGSEHEPLYDRPFLEQNRCFASALTINVAREELL